MTIITIGNKLFIDYTKEEQNDIDKFLSDLTEEQENDNHS